MWGQASLKPSTHLSGSRSWVRSWACLEGDRTFGEWQPPHSTPGARLTPQTALAAPSFRTCRVLGRVLGRRPGRVHGRVRGRCPGRLWRRGLRKRETGGAVGRRASDPRAAWTEGTSPARAKMSGAHLRRSPRGSLSRVPGRALGRVLGRGRRAWAQAHISGHWRLAWLSAPPGEMRRDGGRTGQCRRHAHAQGLECAAIGFGGTRCAPSQGRTQRRHVSEQPVAGELALVLEF